jgi:hypothetical protein
MKKPILKNIPCDAIRGRIYCIEETQGIPETISKDDPTGVVLVKKGLIGHNISPTYLKQK